MRTISVAVSDGDYEVFRSAAKRTNRSIAHLIRDAMALYREERLERRPPLHELPILAGHRLVAPLPSRAEIYDEVAARNG